MANVIYIASAGHSGSTLLDLLIGTLPKVFSTGECVYLPWQLYRRGCSNASATNQDVCSCLMSFRECKMWGPVIQSVSRRLKFDVYEDPLRFRMALLQSPRYGNKGALHERMIRKAYLRVIQYRHFNILAKLCEVLLRRRVSDNWLLFDAIQETCGAKYIVDSSKDIVRMRLLRSHRPKNLHLIVLIRDVRGVAASSLKRGHHPYAEAKAWLHMYNTLDNVVRNMRDLPMLVVTYEELCWQPVRVRKKIASFIGLPSPSEHFYINTHEHHLVAGNPMRYRGKIEINADNAWKNLLDKNLAEKISLIGEELRLSARRLFPR